LDKVHIFSQYNVKSNRERLIGARGILKAVVAFLLGRIVIFGTVSPFGLAFLAAYVASEETASFGYVAMALFGIAGAALSRADISLIKYMLAYVMFGLIYISVTTLSDERKNFSEANMAAVAIFLSGIIFAAQTGFEFYTLLMLLFESVLCGAYAHLMLHTMPILNSKSRQQAFSAAELTGAVTLLLLCVLSVSDVMIGQFSLGNAFAAALIMFSALCAGVPGGVVGGTAIGLVYGMTKYPMTEVVGVFSLCGLMSGSLSKFKKPGIILAFFCANTVLSFYLGGAGSGVFSVLELFVAIIIFYLIPERVSSQAMQIIGKVSGSKTGPTIKFITQKLKETGESFALLAKTFSDIIKPTQNDNFADVTTLFDKTADKVCKRCGLKFVCWEKQFNTTYDSMLKLAPILLETGKIKTSDFGQPFRSRCIRIEEFAYELNRVYGQHRLDMQWQQKATESKELAKEQFAGISKIIDDLASEIGESSKFDLQLEKNLSSELEHAGFKKCEVSVIKNKFSRFEASVRMKKCAKKQDCAEQIAALASSVIGCGMDVRSIQCPFDGNSRQCEVLLLEREKLSICCGAASRTKSGQTQSGDNYNYMPICDGKYVLVLSDGMGSGAKAASKSKATVSLLRQLLGAGFDKQSTVKIINSALLLGADDECFATIDITILDLFSKEAEFIKIGANPTFIKCGKKVVLIKSSTLPAGILSEVDIETSYKSITGGNYIIMASDGVQAKQEGWLEKFISSVESATPQELADTIISEAIKRENGNIGDDMTVMVAKLMEV